MRSKKYFWLAFLLAMGVCLPTFSAVVPLSQSEFGVTGTKVKGRTSTFTINGSTNTEGDSGTEDTEGTEGAPVPLRAPAAEQPSHTSDQCKLTTNQQYVLYKNKVKVTEGDEEKEYFCTCPYFFDDINDARALCDNNKTYEKDADGNPVGGVAPRSDPVSCYYQKEGICGIEPLTWGMTYFGCDCSGYYTKKEFCAAKLNVSYKSEAALAECELNINEDPNYFCNTRMDREGNAQADYGNEVKYQKFTCKTEGVTYYSKDGFWEFYVGGIDFPTMTGLPKTDEGRTEYSNHYVGLGYPCIAEAGNLGVSGYKYTNYGRKCYTSGKSKIEGDGENCTLPGQSRTVKECYAPAVTEDGSDANIYVVQKMQCACPEGFRQTCDHPSYEIPGGTLCEYDVDSIGTSLRKYNKCKIRCGHEYAVAYASGDDGCAIRQIDGNAGGNRLKNGVPEECFLADDVSVEPIYICACPSNFETIQDWCNRNWQSEGLRDVTECLTTYKGSGTPCYRDVTRDENGEPNGVLTKYATYIRSCPSDRPLYYSKEDCEYVGGALDYYCHDGSLNTRAVCKCPTSYYNEDGERETGGDNCTVEGLDVISQMEDEGGDAVTNDIYRDAERYITPNGEIIKWTRYSIESEDFPADATGNYCSLSSENDLRYEQCTVKCSALLDRFAKDGAYIYLSADKTTPTPLKCQNQLGTGAILGYSGYNNGVNAKIYCSSNHELKYPCYCPATFKTCKEEKNMIPAPDATSCTFDNVTYYSSCVPSACSEESEITSVVSLEGGVAEADEAIEKYGQGAVKSAVLCTTVGDDGSEKVAKQISCDKSYYSSTCDYPYTTPRNNNDYCVYTDVSGDRMSSDSAKPHYQSAVCRIRSELGVCGVNILDSDNESLTAEDGYTIQVATTENECYSKYGHGVKTQLCEDDNYNRAYNCYFKSEDFLYTTANCGVRHDLSGDFVLIGGVKHWSTCKCVAAYQHHKYNCAGYLSGNPCKQTINNEIIASDTTLQMAQEDLAEVGRTLIGSELPYYPYCKCSSDFNQVCDEDGSGRYKGVGEICNGKYKACECVPDELPINWTDNYYGCPGGKRPTGVWKDNGCGKKYYQCSVQECTWEYAEKCESPQIPASEPCQDSSGKIGGYKACACPAEYKACPTGQIGVGEPCNLKGVSYYKECKVQDACGVGADKTCTGPLQIGINACTKNNTTFYEKCACAQGYNKVCTNGEVGVGASCELDGTTYYKECSDPKQTTCTPNHVEACTIYQERYAPCVSTNNAGQQVVKYLCRCPSNWTICSDGKSKDAGTLSCTDTSGKTYYEKCYASDPGDGDNGDHGAETCTEYQNANYKVCSSAQKGYGGNCVVKDENDNYIRKYAECEDSTDCAINGFKYSCSGYDEKAQGDFCVDINGNKMYKSCACPTDYVSCTNTNASKGTKCSPLKVDGTFDDPVYSSCTCDKGRFKYTCIADSEEEGGNRGVIKPNSSDASYCTVTEKVKEKEQSEDDDGNLITTEIEEEKEVTYYTYCECNEQYKYTCLNWDSGYINPKEDAGSPYAKDYCLLNTTRFYKGCDCQADYKYSTDAECQEEHDSCWVVDKTSAACSPIGVLGDDSEHISGTVYYKKCKQLSDCTPEPIIPDEEDE